jgi:hypothetical protein
LILNGYGIQTRQRHLTVQFRLDGIGRHDEIGRQLRMSAACITLKPSKSSSVGGGTRVSTFTFTCDQSSPNIFPINRTSWYCISGNWLAVCAHLPFSTINA